jgi:hypothetical protein
VEVGTGVGWERGCGYEGALVPCRGGRRTCLGMWMLVSMAQVGTGCPVTHPEPRDAPQGSPRAAAPSAKARTRGRWVRG